MFVERHGLVNVLEIVWNRQLPQAVAGPVQAELGDRVPQTNETELDFLLQAVLLALGIPDIFTAEVRRHVQALLVRPISVTGTFSADGPSKICFDFLTVLIDVPTWIDHFPIKDIGLPEVAPCH